jgi:hypothetical protein
VLEALLAATATSGLIVLARGQRRVTGVGGSEWVGAQGEEDLPCPWCYSPTVSSDSRCPSCHRRFG